jgi:predicted neuraminidase
MKPHGLLWALAALVAFTLHLLPRRGDFRRSRTVPPVAWSVPPRGAPDSPARPATYREESLGPGEGIASVHVASLAEYTPGRLAAAWYGGSREGARDVAVLVSTREGGTASPWSRPTVVVNQASAQRDLDRFVKKVGNPLLFSDGRGRLQLLFVSIAVGGWSGSSLNLTESADGGVTWTPARRLVLSPFFNVSELVKNPPVPVEGGGWAVPVYQETFGKFPEFLWLDVRDAVASATRSRPFGGRTAFQPALLPLDTRRALLLCRTAGDQTELFGSRTDDGGLHWSAPEPVGLPNPGSGIAAIRLTGGRLLVAFNDSVSGRDILRLAISDDEGRTWRRGAKVIEEPGEEFSYPFLLQTGDEVIHLAYTWKRRAIRHAEFTPAWLEASLKEGAP